MKKFIFNCQKVLPKGGMVIRSELNIIYIEKHRAYQRDCGHVKTDYFFRLYPVN